MVSSSRSEPGAPLAGALLLRGRNSVAQPEMALDRALEGTSQPAAVTGGTSLAVSLCRTASELARSLSHGQALSLGSGPLPLPFLRARREFLESLHTTVFSVSLVVQARRVIEAVEVLHPQLRADLSPPADGAGLDAFVAQFGDSYVSSLQLGGEVQGVYTFYAQSREEAKRVERAFGGAATVAGLALGPEFSRRAAEVARSTGLNTSFRVSVQGLRNVPPLTPGSLVEFAGRFGSMSLDDPQLLELQSRGYETVPELRDAFRPVARNRVLFTGDAFGGGLMRREQLLREVENQCGWVQGTYGVYGIEPDPGLEQQQRRLRIDRAALLELKRQYVRSPSTPLTPPDLPSLATGSPRLNVEVVEGEVMGGDGGEPFAYADRAAAVQSRRRLVEVGMRAGSRIDQIRLRYERTSDAFASSERWQEVHGGMGGSDRGDLQLAPGGSIAVIDARTGRPHGQVDRLSLTSGDGRTLAGGDGRRGNTDMHWHRDANEVLLGFSGRAGSELDALQAVIARFGPLAWEPLEEGEVA